MGRGWPGEDETKSPHNWGVRKNIIAHRHPTRCCQWASEACSPNELCVQWFGMEIQGRRRGNKVMVEDERERSAFYASARARARTCEQVVEVWSLFLVCADPLFRIMFYQLFRSVKFRSYIFWPSQESDKNSLHAHAPGTAWHTCHGSATAMAHTRGMPVFPLQLHVVCLFKLSEQTRVKIPIRD